MRNRLGEHMLINVLGPSAAFRFQVQGIMTNFALGSCHYQWGGLKHEDIL